MTDWHSRFDGIEWRVTPLGIEVRGDGLLRTKGAPRSMRLYLAVWGDELRAAATAYDVPLTLLLMTLGTENGPARLADGGLVCQPPREEPGYISDYTTPHRVSVGPCHVLLSTARAVLNRPSLTRAELAVLGVNLRAAAAYIRGQRDLTGYDPILVAASYNAGGLYDSRISRATNPRLHNRWHLRAYDHDGPEGAGKDHLTRAAEWYGDACAVVMEHRGLSELDDRQLGRVVTEASMEAR